MLQQQDGAGVETSSDRTAASRSLGETRPKAGNGGTIVSSNGAPVPADQHKAQRCPRCDSLNTKFCYYNNYSLSQPRHFCKNCRRYWTKGGAQRNVPVGGGCRKNKRLKHRDANSIAEMQDVPSTSLLSSVTGCGGPLQLPLGFGPSTCSLISELAREGHGYGMSIFSGVQESLHLPESSIPMSTQEFFTVGSPPDLLSTADPFNAPAFRASTSYSKSEPAPAMFHHPHELTTCFEHHNSGQSFLIPVSDPHHDSSGFASSVTESPALLPADTTTMDNSPFRLNLPLPAMEAHDERGNHINGNREDIGFQHENEEMILLKSKGMPSVCFQHGACTASADEGFFVPPSSTAPQIQSSLWNVSWPEMHAALAGSSNTAAGAMLH